MIFFILTVGLLGRYVEIKYQSQTIYYNPSIIFYGMVKVYP